jgi:hypothetical protein
MQPGFILNEYVPKLFKVLGEEPIDRYALWCAYWGGDDIPNNVAQLAQDLCGATQSRTILIHSRYGMGKSSFMKILGEQIRKIDEKEEAEKKAKAEVGAERKEAEEEMHIMTLWLAMPSITSNVESSTLAVVIAKIVEKLAELAIKTGNETAEGLDKIKKLLDDLWYLEMPTISCERSVDPWKEKGIIRPEPNRRAGTKEENGRAMVVAKANSLEKAIADFLRVTLQRRLIVFLDDLDRCKKEVAKDVIRLLLRFCTASGDNRESMADGNVHFVLGCDWDVLEKGVEDWMKDHGTDGDGRSLVTANSALEKYIHNSVELPGMGAQALWQDAKRPMKIPEGVRDMLRETEGGIITLGHKERGKYSDKRLFDVLVNDLMNSVFADDDKAGIS